MVTRRERRSWGAVRKLPSGRWQASYAGPDGARHTADTTYTSKLDAEAWLSAQRIRIERGEWSRGRPAQRPETVREYSERWLTRRTVKGAPLRPSTLALYRRLLNGLVYPTFGELYLAEVSPEDVEDWYYSLKPDAPTRRAHAYALLRTILGSAVHERKLHANPCEVTDAGTRRRAPEPTIATLAELDAIRAALPDRLGAMVTLAAWGALRYGELAELRRRDVDLGAGTVRVERAVGWPNGSPEVGPPKTSAGRRAVALPPHVLPELAEHMADHVGPGRDALLFPGNDNRQMPYKTWYRYWHPAREAAGRPDLKFHHLRHTGLTLAARAGATTAELMRRAGHASPAAMMVYQHADETRDRAIAQSLSRLATEAD
ncbi:tyrosine-type recombinase/integrase [Demequina maris]|uniref:tyrosine-type recombinase/integrase n=1 Tax=Demequina maris TaxID=1638982 RepID=UPI0009E2A953|nr:site-specific integrase [Demequina maris]